jgi:2-methylcitrate dehydratase PrpD
MTYALEQLGALGSTMQIGASETESACAAILDLVTAATAAPSSRIAGALRSVYGPGPAALWLTGESGSASAAGFHNALIAARLDLDDGHRKARGHPGAAVIPAVFAEADRMAAEGQNVTDQAMLRAIVIGYELGLRIAAARGFYARTGFWAGFAAAAGAGALRGLSAGALAHALAIGGETGPHMATTTALPAWPQPVGSDVKEGIPWGVCAGLAAAALAEAGMTGPLDLVDHAPFFDRDAVLAARPGAAIAEAYTKFYAACRHCHAPVDAFLEVVGSNAVALEQIDAIHVGAYSGALRISNHPAPRNLAEAQYSIPYCLGLVAVDGAEALLPMTEASLGNEAAEAVARKVSLSIEPDCEARFPAETVVRVSVAARGQTYTSRTTGPRGEASEPPGWDERLEKFDVATASRLGHNARAKWHEAFVDLRRGNLAAVRQHLGERLTSDM